MQENIVKRSIITSYNLILPKKVSQYASLNLEISLQVTQLSNDLLEKIIDAIDDILYETRN